MAGLLAVSIGSGQVISKTGKYRFFPIAGTALMTLGLYLLSLMGVQRTGCRHLRSHVLPLDRRPGGAAPKRILAGLRNRRQLPWQLAVSNSHPGGLSGRRPFAPAGDRVQVDVARGVDVERVWDRQWGG